RAHIHKETTCMTQGLPVLPWYTQVALWLLLALLGLLAWGLCSAGKSLVFGWTLRRLMRIPDVLRSLWGSLGGQLGTAHWATAREVRQAGLLYNDQLPLAQWRGQTLYEPTGGNVALVGPQRSRKSWGVIMPVLRQWQGSVIVSDLRGELHAQTAQGRA